MGLIVCVAAPTHFGSGRIDAALDVWDHVDIADVRARSIELGEAFVKEVSSGCPSLSSPAQRPMCGFTAFYHFEQGYAAMQAMIDHQIIEEFPHPI